MLKQTQGDISFLLAEYKAVLKNAAIAAMAAGFAVQASATDYVYNSPSEFTSSSTVLTSGDSWTFNGPGTRKPTTH